MADAQVQGIQAAWGSNEAKALLTGRKGTSEGTESQRTGYQEKGVSKVDG